MALIGGGRATRAKVYPGELRKTTILGLRNQMFYGGLLEKGLIGAVDATDELKDFVLKLQDYKNVSFYDGVSGKELPKDITISQANSN